MMIQKNITKISIQKLAFRAIFLRGVFLLILAVSANAHSAFKLFNMIDANAAYCENVHDVWRSRFGIVSLALTSAKISDDESLDLEFKTRFLRCLQTDGVFHVVEESPYQVLQFNNIIAVGQSTLVTVAPMEVNFLGYSFENETRMELLNESVGLASQQAFKVSIRGAGFDAFINSGKIDFLFAKKALISNDRGQSATERYTFGLYKLVNQE